jgi:hypothetical protein
VCKLSQPCHAQLLKIKAHKTQGVTIMLSSNPHTQGSPMPSAEPQAGAVLARSWLYRLAEQSGFGQLEHPAPMDSRLPPDFDQRVRQVGEW